MHEGRSSSRFDGTNTIPLRVAARVPANDAATKISDRMCVMEGFALYCVQAARKWLILKRRDVRVVEGARLENDSGELHRATPKHLFTQSIQRLPAAECLLM